MATVRPRVLEFEVSVDRDRTARSALGGGSLEREEEWCAEHLVLAGLVRCLLASADHTARRLELEIAGSGQAHGTVTKRQEDGLYGLVDVEVRLEVEVRPAPAPETLAELIERAERGCFVGNSLTATPRYVWTVNGEAVE
jgi:organic hydroperoxide reductase OsmC/OhrA